MSEVAGLRRSQARHLPLFSRSLSENQSNNVPGRLVQGRILRCPSPSATNSNGLHWVTQDGAGVRCRRLLHMAPPPLRQGAPAEINCLSFSPTALHSKQAAVQHLALRRKKVTPSGDPETSADL